MASSSQSYSTACKFLNTLSKSLDPFLKLGLLFSDPIYFNDEWMAKIKSDTNENWRLKVSIHKSIRKIFKQKLIFDSFFYKKAAQFEKDPSNHNRLLRRGKNLK
jgi:hypothetical protein